jgi:hypothetical protein
MPEALSMPLDYSVDHRSRRVLVKGSDPVDPAIVIDLLDRQAIDGAWAYATLEDLRGMSWIPSSAELRLIIGRIQSLSHRHGRRGPVALVTSDNQALFGMFRMYATFSEMELVSAPINAFRTVEEAERWLDAGKRTGPAAQL